jgi:predicted Zn-dependent protease
MRNCNKYRVILAVWCFCFLAHSCAVNPVTGKRELNLLSESDEIRLGAESDPAIVAEYGLYDDPKIQSFIDEIGQKMAAVSHRPQLKFTFRVVDSPIVNAFALPGGYVYFTRGILGYMNSEAELAGVLGHEIGHVTARHGAKAYTRQQLAQVGLTAGYVFSETVRQYGDAAQMAVGLMFLRFSRDQERESDELGVAYSTDIGYDASRMSAFFGTLNRLQEESGQSLPGWFSTHPNPEDREAKTLELARAARAKAAQKNLETGRDRYLDLIDGIIYGADPRQGFVEDGMFYHPTLDFQFAVPAGWQVNNLPDRVQMANKEQTAGIQFSLAQNTTAGAAAEQFITQSGAKVLGASTATTNGFKTEVRTTVIQNEDGSEIEVLSYFIEKDQNVFIFHGFCARANFSAHQAAFKHTMSNFDRLKNQKARDVEPTRIKIVKAVQSEPLEQFLNRHPSRMEQPDKLAIINGMELTDMVKPGDRLKILSQ